MLAIPDHLVCSYAHLEESVSINFDLLPMIHGAALKQVSLILCYQCLEMPLSGANPHWESLEL